jgi:hypothetical protein
MSQSQEIKFSLTYKGSSVMLHSCGQLSIIIVVIIIIIVL